ncbi:hypothetical protein DFP72DRAFT_908467 [Ephemerocybe angulata]|uniref:F-box domain-containing protein n=1 Tax=Ephemerocybe angulata TaxID=980116 RepID=A0A8H6M4F1_9AGAR|nr:hypothetical protein DFP72DRAFT_908467 [Tulosesus angulatus]
MNICLQAPEVLQLICQQLSNEYFGRRYLLAAALSCRALLEPALDMLWYSLPSFKPIVTTLPSDLWKVEKEGGSTFRKWTIMGVRRAITTDDLDRYMTYYARRVREVNIGGLKITLTPEAWHGLQMATSWKHGALSPFAYKVSWPLTGGVQYALPSENLNQSLPFFSLFLGPDTTVVDFTYDSRVPIHAASIRSAYKIPSKLKILSLNDIDRSTSGLVFLENYLRTSSWDHLEILRVPNVTPKSLAQLSTLPVLATLDLWDLSGIPHLYTYSDDDLEAPPEHISSMSGDAFRSLKILKARCKSTFEFEALLQHVPPRNQVHSLKCLLGSIPSSRDIGSLFTSIRLHCNPESLRKLGVQVYGDPEVEEESLKVEVNEGVNLRPLLDFEKLETLSLNLSTTGINLNPEDIDYIVECFPSLVKLKIDANTFDSRLPLIDHSHFLKLIYGLKHLRKLGLRFNATNITGDEDRPGALSEGKGEEEKHSGSLKMLWVGDSPIYSSDRVASFLKRHCPELESSIYTIYFEEDPPERMPVMVYKRRWEAVETS